MSLGLKGVGAHPEGEHGLRQEIERGIEIASERGAVAGERIAQPYGQIAGGEGPHGRAELDQRPGVSVQRPPALGGRSLGLAPSKLLEPIGVRLHFVGYRGPRGFQASRDLAGFVAPIEARQRRMSRRRDQRGRESLDRNSEPES